MRNERLYLADMLDAIDEISAFIQNCAKEKFVADRVLRAAVLQQLTIVGEAASRVSRGTRAKHPEIPWPDIVAFRNIAIHAYFAVDWEIVWTTATINAPGLRPMIENVLKALP